MTNREWLVTLSDADLAKMMQACVHCIYSKGRRGNCLANGEIKGACVTGTMRWLAAEHTERDEEDLKSFDNWNELIAADGINT